MTRQPAVFLDRDGTLVPDANYLSRLEDLRWFPWSIDAVRLLNRAGFLVFVVTNQGGVALGMYPETFVHEVHAVMASALEAGGARVDGWFYCPHHPESKIEALRIACDCRKPGTGMIRQAQAKFDIDLARSFAIGDKLSDVQLATAVGARGVLVKTGYGETIVRANDPGLREASHVAEDLMAATAWLLAESGHPQDPA